VITGVAVEKLICGKMSQIASRLDIDFFNTHSQYGVTGADAPTVG
jgi:hypothetical protein